MSFDEVFSDDESTQQNSEILIKDGQTTGNDVKETQEQTVTKGNPWYSDDDEYGNENNVNQNHDDDSDNDVVEGSLQQDSFYEPNNIGIQTEDNKNINHKHSNNKIFTQKNKQRNNIM